MSDEPNNAGSNEMDMDTQEFLQSFVSEAIDTLDENEPKIDGFEVDDNFDITNSIFRAFHTLKGLSGFFGLNVISEVTHNAENMLDKFRQNPVARNQEEIQLIYDIFDFLRQAIALVDQEGSDASCQDLATGIINAVKNRLEIMNDGEAEEEEEDSESIDEMFNEAAKAQNEQKPADSSLETPEQTEDDEPFKISFDDVITHETIEKFLTDAGNLLEKCEEELLKFEDQPKNKEVLNEIFGNVHSLKGNAELLGYKEIVEVCSAMESTMTPILEKQAKMTKDLGTVLFSQLDAIKEQVNNIDPEEAEAEDQPKIDLSDENVEEVKKTEAPKEEAPKKEEKPKEETKAEKPKEETKSTKPATPSKPQLKKPGDMQPGQTITIQKKDIRVDTNKLDQLFNLVGELITIESMVVNNQDLHGLELHNFQRSANMLNKVIRELQEVTLSIRMMPLEGTFNKMKRLVRDLSKKFNKQVSLHISGEETEMDKNVIEEIADPLVHILRNSIDHGVESPEVRQANGKPPTGNVKLSARYDGNEILIIIEDDGKGLHREKLLNKAIERGVVKGDPDKLTDSDVWNLIFEPGFSTAEKVTDISGRGVGMDVVKRNIEKLRGRINIESVTGQGTKQTLHIPLTLAIMEGMLVRSSKSIYAIPMLTIRESFRPNPEDITETMDGLEMVKVRDELFPIIRLHEIYNQVPDSYDLDKGILVIVESRERRVCLFVDEIIGQRQIVIKALPSYMGSIEGITGCMVLADGDIGLILDVDNLISRTEIEASNQKVS